MQEKSVWQMNFEKAVRFGTREKFQNKIKKIKKSRPQPNGEG